MSGTFNLEDKIRWEELAPSLQAKIVQLIKDTVNAEINNTSSNIYKSLMKAIKDSLNSTAAGSLRETIRTVLSAEIKDSNSEINKAIDTKIKNSLTSAESDLYKTLQKFIADALTRAIDGTDTESTLYNVIRGLIFTNLPPKVGFLDDTKVNLQGAFNMSYMSGMAGPFFITDAEGRECLFGVATGTSYSSIAIPGVYRATRMNASENFGWENNAIRPKFIQEMSGYTKSTNGALYDNIRTTSIWALTSEYIGLTVHFDSGNTDRNYLVFTNNSGSPHNWTNETGYLQVDNVPNVAYMARIVNGSTVYYVIPSIETVTAASTDPISGSVDSVQKLYFTIYRATENKTNHTVSLTQIRKDAVADYGWIYNSVRSYLSSCSLPRLSYIKHKKFLFAVTTNPCGSYRYDKNNNRYEEAQNGTRRWQWGLINVSNISNALASSTSNWFGADNNNKRNWSVYKLGSNFNHFTTGHGQWGKPVPAACYDDLKRALCFCFHENVNWGGTPSRSRLTICKLDTDSGWSEFVNYIENNAIASEFPYSFTVDKTTHGNFYKGIEEMAKVILSDDTAPWSKSILYAFIIHDTFILGCSSKKYNTGYCHITPTLLRNPVNNAIYNNNIFTCTVGKWSIVSANYTWTKYSMVYTGGDYSELYRYDETTRNVYKTISASIKLNDGTTATTYQPGVSEQLVTTFPAHDYSTLLQNYYASEISTYKLSVNTVYRAYSVYGNNSYLGGEFILHLLCLRCNITGNTVNNAGLNDDNLRCCYPVFLLYFKNGTIKVYNTYNIALNTNASIATNMKRGIIDRPLLINSSITGNLYSLSDTTTFIDKDGSITSAFGFGIDLSSRYAPYVFGFDFRNNKLYSLIRGTTPWTGFRILGYSKSLGYYMSHRGSNYDFLQLFCQKDYLSNGAIKSGSTSMITTLDSSNHYYSKYMYTNSSVGKIAFLPKTALYLGGYFSYIESQEIYLNEGHNYIYIVRNIDNFQTKIEVYDHMIGIPGQSQFNRILISHIIVANGVIATQVDYDIAYYAISSVV